MKCPKCQQENEANASFCSSCGVKLKREETPKWLWTLLILTFLALGGVIYGLFEVYQLTQEKASVSVEPVATESAKPVSTEDNAIQTSQKEIEENAIQTPQKEENKIDRVTLIKDVQQKVFTVLTSNGHGSGFLYAKGGYVATNAHVVDGEIDVIVRNSKGQEYEAKVIGISEHFDIALLHVPDYKNEEPLPVERAESPVGLEVVAFGSPNGFENSASTGYITGQNRDMQLDRFIYKQIYQVDAQIDQGSSGGPLVAATNGKVIGINSLLYTSETSTTFAFSIPLYSMVEHFDKWIQQPMNRQSILAVAGIHEQYNYNSEANKNENSSNEEIDVMLAGQFVQSFRIYYEKALNDGNFHWIEDMVTGDAYTELEKYIADIADEGHEFHFNNNEILDAIHSNGSYLVETNETFDFYSATGDSQSYDRYKTYTVITDEYGAFKISNIKIH